MLLCALAACQAPQTDVADAAQRLRAHEGEFAEFCRWVRRAHHGRPAGRDRDALAETVFAPVRHTQQVLAAWLVPTEDEHRLAMPTGAELPAAAWVAVRSRRLGITHVASFASCPLDVPRWWRRDVDGPCVLLANDIEVDGDAVRVIIAYRDFAQAPAEAGAALAGR